MLNNLRVGAKLIGGFSIVVLLGFVIGIIGITNMANLSNMNSRLYEKELLGVSYTKEANVALVTVGRSLRSALLTTNQADREKFVTLTQNKLTETKEWIEKAEALFYTDKGRELLRKIDIAMKDYEQVVNQILQIASKENYMDTRASLDMLADLAKKGNIADDLLTDASDQKEENAKRTADDGVELYESSRNYMIALIILAAGSGFLIGLVITRNLTRQLGGEPVFATEIANRIAAGDLSSNIKLRTGDTDSLMAAMQRMSTTLNEIVSDMRFMSNEHDKGDIDTMIDVSKFRGTFADMVKGTNVMVTDHITLNRKAMACIKEFGEGNFDAELEKFPGKKAFINDTVELVRGNMKGIVGDINHLSAAIAEGDLSVRVDAARFKGDYRTIIETLGVAIERLSESLHQIISTIEQVGQTAEQLNAASQNMASTSEEQSSSVEEMTSSLEETDSQVKANTDNANAANQLVIGASEAANQGQLKMEGMMEAMSAINLSAQNIAKIIKVIDEIAFQTNLLALNAAVEAARAGQHGRGFAVVAQEVRNLAGRSAKAARETANLIEDSTKRVREGVESAGNTREALNQIVTNVVKVKDLMAEIATASLEQSRGVTQINIAMNQVSQAAQTSSQQAEELASSATELSNVANQMRTEVNRFKLRVRQPGLSLSKAEKDELTRILMPTTAVETRKSMTPARHAVSLEANKPPKTVLPLDQDERGFGEF